MNLGRIQTMMELHLDGSKYRYHTDGAKPVGEEIFVFGSNTAGRHGKGAALTAKRKYGAVYGVGEGRTGNAYGIPTKEGGSLNRLGLKRIRLGVKRFRKYTKENKELTFFITRVGCGHAGYTDKDIAVMFRGASIRCRFPIEWKEYLE